MEHRQSPQIYAVESEADVQGITKRRQIGAAMAVDHTLRIAGGAGCVQQAERLPLVDNAGRAKLRIGGSKQLFIVMGSERCVRPAGNVDVNDRDILVEQYKCLLDQRRVVSVD